MKISAPTNNDELPKNLKYLIMIFQEGTTIKAVSPKNIQMASVSFEYKHPDFVGFSGGQHGTIYSQFFTGSEKKQKHFGRIVQLPKLFNNKKEVFAMIKIHKKADKAFRQKHTYKVVPIDIGNGILTQEQQKTSKRIIRRIYFTLDDKKIQQYNKTQLRTTCARLKTEISWLVDALMINVISK